MGSTVCSLDVASLLGTAPPFARVVAFGYDDGPTSGVVECTGGDLAYRFDLLATDVDGTLDPAAWDRGEELRIYALAPLPPNTFGRIVAALATAQQPRWPIWLVQGGFGGGSLPASREAEVAALLDLAAPPELVIASSGLLQPVAAAGGWPADGTNGVRDWFAYLGLARP
jgi:hypothetical protein